MALSRKLRHLPRTAVLGIMLVGEVFHQTAQQGPSNQARQSSIEGRLATTTGRPVVDARIIVRRASADGTAVSSESWEQNTDASGRFGFRSLPPGRYTVSASHPNFLPAEYGQRFVGERGRPIDVQPGDAITANLVAVRGGVVTGRVFDETGEPISDVSVVAYRWENQGTARNLVQVPARLFASNDVGQYRIANLPPGKVFIAASLREQRGMRTRTGHGYAPSWFPGVETVAMAQPVTVRAEEESAGADFRLWKVPFTDVAGNVMSSTKQGARGVFVTLSATDGNRVTQPVVLTTRTDNSGRFELKRIPPGSYEISAEHELARGSAGSEARYEFASHPLTVRGEGVLEVSVALRPATKVMGRVNAPRGLGPNRRLTFLATEPPARSQTASLDSSGAFELLAGPGQYRLAVSGMPADWFIESVIAGGADVTTTGIRVKQESLVDVVMTLSDRSARVSGTARVGLTTSVNYTAVAIPVDERYRTMAAGLIRSARPNQRGEFTLVGLRGLEYVIAAFDYVNPQELFEPDFWREIESGGMRVTLTPGEQRQIQLTVAARR